MPTRTWYEDRPLRAGIGEFANRATVEKRWLSRLLFICPLTRSNPFGIIQSKLEIMTFGVVDGSSRGVARALGPSCFEVLWHRIPRGTCGRRGAS
jgi:hypothetical protein